ncbi:Uma2 family endonuclease [Actinomadura violacea]|uniref:Uma2 family endonuclease n=1 Tax=Actinomadura violacea TaxID=2819934 RepID=A0ABS3RKT5_9ACTN|nr:Uma2 family endonuclease [Actinomadura violacea]MBO2457342.1 Uma2 family endonuclease [Actinomadura violacea]
MTTMVHEPRTQEDILLNDFLSLDLPDGYRAELVDGEIVVTPPPVGDHELCISKIVAQVLRHSATEFDFSGHKGLVVPSGGPHPKSHVIPDATFAPADLGLLRGAPSWMPVEPDGVAMVVEVTSSRPELDREAKRYGYARAGIPLYLLVDRQEQRVTLFSGPDGKDYEFSDRVPFGKAISLPEPFGIELDTAEFA